MSRIAALVACGCLVALLGAGTVSAAETDTRSRPTETTGRLSIVSQPGVEIIWEGVSLGETDAAGLLVIEGIPPGGYELQLLKPGYRARASQVEIEPGSQSGQLRLQPVLPKPARPRPAVEAPPRQVAEPLTKPQAGPETASGPPTAGGGLPPPVGAEHLTAQPPSMGPAPPAADSHAAAEPGDALPLPRDGAIPPLLYLLGLGMLAATVAVALHRRLRARAQAVLPAHPGGLPLPLPREIEDEPSDFLDELQEREKHLEERVDQLHADAIDVEVIDLGPAEDAS